MCQCRFNVRVLGCFFALDMRAFMNDSAEPRVIIYAYDAVRVAAHMVESHVDQDIGAELAAGGGGAAR